MPRFLTNTAQVLIQEKISAIRVIRGKVSIIQTASFSATNATFPNEYSASAYPEKISAIRVIRGN